MKLLALVFAINCFVFSFSTVLESNFFFKVAPPEAVSVLVGSVLELDCQAGGPSPVIHWLYNGEVIVQVIYYSSTKAPKSFFA